MGTFPVKVDIPASKDLCTIDVGPLNFDMANAFTDIYKINGEGVKSDMKKSTEAELYATGVFVSEVLEKTKKINCEVDRIIFNQPATIVFWKDGSKTVVKCHGDQTFNPYYGFCAALAKHIYKSNSAVNRMVDKYVSEMTKGTSKKVNAGDTDGDGYVGVITNEDKSQTVNSLQYDHNLVRICNNCKYKSVSTWEYPCSVCCHVNLSTNKSLWKPNDSKKEDK